jgi:hypothetical protein
VIPSRHTPRVAAVAVAVARLGVLVAAGFSAADAEARTTSVVPYPTTDVWPTAIRFLRVDRDYPIKEKDEAAGYVLFEIAEGKRAYRAALELVKAADADGRAGTQLVLNIQDLPRHYEVALLDKLTAKIRDERGPPPPLARKPPASGGETAPPAPPKDGKRPGDRPGDLGDLPGPPIWGPGESK